MYDKFLIVASKKDKAGINITTQLSQFRKIPMASMLKTEKKLFDFYLVEDSVLYSEGLDMEKINKYDFVIFASKHSSGKREKALAVHAVGNWRKAEFGGEDGKAGKSSALFQKFLFEKLKENADRHSLNDYDITMEATHHGPLIDKPCLFIEIGSTDAEYNDRRAAFVAAKAISEAIEDFKENPYNEIAIAVGGPHYCPNFNKIQLKSNIAISHVIPGYAIPVTEEMIREAVAKTEEEIDFVLLDWKGLGKAEQRDEIVKILGKLYLSYKKSGDIEK